jgi:hypothetical protein
MTLIVFDSTGKIFYTVSTTVSQMAANVAVIPGGKQGAIVDDSAAPGGNIAGLSINVVGGVATITKTVPGGSPVTISPVTL